MEILSWLIIPATLPVSSFPMNGEFFDFDLMSWSETVHLVSGLNNVSKALLPFLMLIFSSPNNLRGLTDKSSTHFSG